MEKWQRSHINGNLPELIQNINCDTLFLSYLCQFGVFGDGDIKTLDANGNQHDKTKCLLNILVTRTGAYQQLAKSLYSCKQTGALLILLRGVEENVPGQGSFQFCGIELNEEEKLLNTNVLFEGALLPLKNTCNPIGDSSWQNMITCHLDADTYHKFLTRNPITIATETIPVSPSYYVPRSLVMATRLDPVVFDKLQNDIFCIEEIELHQLSSLAKSGKHNSSARRSQMVDTSRNQIHRRTARFILLESPEHFQHIFQKSSEIVHWLKYHKGEYFYVRSSAGHEVKKIQQFLSDEITEIFTEDQFIGKYIDVLSNSPILIHDSPGMGKSVLLAELARKLKVARPERNVIYFSLPDLINSISSSNVSYTSSGFKRHLSKLVTKCCLGRSIIQNLLDSDSHRVELFLDAYDEIPDADTDFANSLLDCILKDCKNIRMWITTRPHKRHELEEHFGLLGHNILPFDDANKISFFLKYWQDQHDIMPTKQVKLFAERCLKTITRTMSSETDIAGIPLQCKMLADIFASDAKLGDLVRSQPHLQFSSVFQMYKEFMDVKFSSVEPESTKLELKNFHVNVAMRTLFSMELVMMSGESRDVETEAVYKLGILEPCKSDPDRMIFVHRTFAEFLAAEYVVTSVTTEYVPRAFGKLKQDMDMLFNTCLATEHDEKCHISGTYISFYRLTGNRLSYVRLRFTYPVLVQFLDFFFSVTHSSIRLGYFKHFLRKSKYHNSEAFFELLVVSLKVRAIHLLNFLLDAFLDFSQTDDGAISPITLGAQIQIVGDGEEAEKLVNYLRDRRGWNWIIYFAARISSLEMVTLISALVERVTGRHWHLLDFEEGHHPICAAMKRGQYQTVEYLLNFNREGFYEESVLHWCLERSLKNLPEVIAEKVQIIKLVLNDRPDLLNRFHPEYKCVPLLTRRAHFELTKCLIEAGAQLIKVDILGRNIAHLATEYFSSETYHQLVTLLVSRNAAMLFKQRDRHGFTPVHWAIRRIELKTETLDILASKCNIDFNDIKNRTGRSELAYAIKHGRSERLVNDILRLGGQMQKTRRSTVKGET